MAINERVITGTTAEAGNGAAADAEQGLILHLDANDVDSYDGDGSIWYDISEHDVTIPLSDNADDLELHLNASDSTSYDPDTDTTTWTDIVGSNDATMTSMGVANFDKDNGGYFSFDGANDYMTISNDTSFASATNFSVEMWVNPVSIGSDEMLATLYGSSSDQKFDIRFSNSSGNIRFIAGTSSGGFNSGQDLTSASALSTNTWHHIAAVYDDTNDKMFIYIDGELDATKTGASSGTYTSITDPILIGKRTDGFHSNIKLGAFRFYSKALSASEIGQNYRHGRDYIYTDLYDSDLELHLDAGDNTTVSASTWTDLTSNSYDGTFTNFSSTLTDFYNKELGNFITFDGTNDYVKINNTSLTKSVGTDFSVEAWARMHTTGTVDYIASQTSDDGNLQNWLFRFNPDDKIKFYVYGTDAYLSTTSTYSANVWYHIVGLVESNGTVRIYVNGELEASSSSGKSADTVARNTFIGSLGSQQTTDSDIGQVRIYHTALTQDQIRQNFNFTKNDYPNGNDGTISGATWNSGDYFDFDGTNDIVTLDSDMGFVSRTWQAWVNPDVIQRQYILNTYGSTITIGAAWVEMNANGTIRAGVRNSSNVSSYDDSSTTLSTNSWNHICMTTDGTNLKLYINGTLDFTVAANLTSIASNSQNLVIGKNIRTNSFYWNGQMSDIKVFDRALSAAEVTAQFAIKQFDIG